MKPPSLWCVAALQALEELSKAGVRFVAMRCAGYDRVDLGTAKRLGMKVVRVPTYSPRSVAEFALALLFELARCEAQWKEGLLVPSCQPPQPAHCSLPGVGWQI